MDRVEQTLDVVITESIEEETIGEIITEEMFTTHAIGTAQIGTEEIMFIVIMSTLHTQESIGIVEDIIIKETITAHFHFVLSIGEVG